MNNNQNSSWKPVLYNDEIFDDDYSERDLGITYKDQIPYDYWTCVIELQCVVQELSIVCLFVITYIHLLYNTLSLNSLLLMNGLLLFIVVFTLPIWSIILIINILFILSPIFKSLTDSTSDDTIISLSIIFLIVHLFTHDYAFVNGYSIKFQYNISLNAVMAVSVLFASRLSTPLHSFAIILFCMLLFLIFPFFRNYLKKYIILYQCMTVGLSILTISLLLYLSYLLAFIFLLSTLTLTFLIPNSLLYLQQFKREIEGPWDIVKLEK